MSSLKSEKDLLAKIREQEEQLNRYKKRLQDVVCAHKKLIVEKEHLEDSLKIVTNATVKTSGEINVKDLDKQEIAELKSKINKLTQSLSFLSNEKCQLETQLLAERKQLILQNSQLEEKLKSVLLYVENPKKVQEIDAKSIRAQLNLEDQQRELEFSSNFRELQNILTEERNKKEERELFIEKLKVKLKGTQEKLNECKESENQLKAQLADISKRFNNDDSPHIVMEKLKLDIQLMKEQNSFAEQMRAYKAEERTRRLAVDEHENRVSKLEQKLAQLSDVASNYEKNRQEDQQTIMKLKNRLMQLELENSNTKCEDDRSSLNEEAAIQQLQHIKQQLISNCKTFTQLSNLKNILLKGIESDNEDESKQFKERYIALKQQFDDLRQKMNKNKNNDEIILLKQKIHNLKAKIFELESLKSGFEEELQTQHEITDKLVEKERELWKSKLSVSEAKFRNKLITMEEELEKRRERVNVILEDKEKQIVTLQQYLTPIYQLSGEPSMNVRRTSIDDISKRQNSTSIHYMEDVARKEIEIRRLRTTNNELQVKIHDMEQECFRQIQLYYQLQQDNQRY